MIVRSAKIIFSPIKALKMTYKTLKMSYFPKFRSPIKMFGPSSITVVCKTYEPAPLQNGPLFTID